jgi:predicted dehydrogenase
MNDAIDRRTFLKQTSLFAAGVAAITAAPAIGATGSANNRIRVAVMGCNGRGMYHIRSFGKLKDAQIAYVCDVDSRAVAKGIEAVEKEGHPAPKGAADIRKVLEDKDLDAISIAAPEHWHAPATIMACSAGKHVYVEKPASHNPRECELMVQAARKNKRVVQMGNQRRSWPWVIESIKAVHDAEVGEPQFARGWYTNRRESIGNGKPAPIPEWLNYDLWQGPAPETPYRDNILHYNWHWFWNWGTGELGNNAVHALDLARWGLKVGLPRRVTCGGGRYFFQDDWETPDTIIATYDYGNKAITWDGQSCAPRGFEGSGFGVSFFCNNGTIVMDSDCKIYDKSNKLIREIKGNQKDLFAFDSLHFQNFLDGIREGKQLAADIEEGQKSTMLCHLANIAWRTGHTLDFDEAKNRILKDSEAMKLWGRTYRKGWEPRV